MVAHLKFNSEFTEVKKKSKHSLRRSIWSDRTNCGLHLTWFAVIELYLLQLLPPVYQHCSHILSHWRSADTGRENSFLWCRKYAFRYLMMSTYQNCWIWNKQMHYLGEKGLCPCCAFYAFKASSTVLLLVQKSIFSIIVIIGNLFRYSWSHKTLHSTSLVQLKFSLFFFLIASLKSCSLIENSKNAVEV